MRVALSIQGLDAKYIPKPVFLDVDRHDPGMKISIAALGQNPQFPAVPDKSIRNIAHASTPVSLPAFLKASRAKSRSSFVRAALIWVRMRAWPFGTTGKKKPET